MDESQVGGVLAVLDKMVGRLAGHGVCLLTRDRGEIKLTLWTWRAGTRDPYLQSRLGNPICFCWRRLLKGASLSPITVSGSSRATYRYLGHATLMLLHFLGTLLHFLTDLLSDLLGFLTDLVRRFCSAVTRVFRRRPRLIHDLDGGVGSGSSSFLGFCAHRVSCFFRPLGGLHSGLLGFFTNLVRRFCGAVTRVFCLRPRLIHDLDSVVGSGFGGFLGFCAPRVSCLFRPLRGLLGG